MNRQGFFRNQGRGESRFRSFVPTPLQQIHIEVDDEMRQLLQQARTRLAALGHDEAALQEETEASVRLAWGVQEPSPFMFGAGMLLQNQDERQQKDEGNLAKATAFAVERMEILPLSGRLLTDIHYVMMQGEHNEKKYPGEFRHTPTWIGRKEDTLFTAAYVPPVEDDFRQAWNDLENYIHVDDGQDVLIKAALIHYQFEMLHPFIDGNGRMGRLLAQLFLMDRGVLAAPSLRQSVFLNRHQYDYFSGLARIEFSGAYEAWVKFYLKALAS